MGCGPEEGRSRSRCARYCSLFMLTPGANDSAPMPQCRYVRRQGLRKPLLCKGFRFAPYVLRTAQKDTRRRSDNRRTVFAPAPCDPPEGRSIVGFLRQPRQPTGPVQNTGRRPAKPSQLDQTQRLQPTAWHDGPVTAGHPSERTGRHENVRLRPIEERDLEHSGRECLQGLRAGHVSLSVLQAA
jgi:hypothetical protein